MNLLITGGCGFIGSHLSLAARRRGWATWAADNFSRLGSRFNIERMQQAGVTIVDARVQHLPDFQELPPMDTIVIAAAEPSVLSGIANSPTQAIDTNLMGAANGLELARRWNADVVFLSSSRVYSISQLRSLPRSDTPTRFEWSECGSVAGFSSQGIAEAFSTKAPVSIYGATKLAAETLIAEYRHTYGIRAVVNRCGLVSGPWQMGRSDQGVIALWVASHLFGRDLGYTGFDGSGRQVRDVLHIDDLCELLIEQVESPENWDGCTLNVGGGYERAISLLELTKLCEQVTHRKLAIGNRTETSVVDIPIYITDNRQVTSRSSWRPRKNVEDTVVDLAAWLQSVPEALKKILQGR
ncbi:MAG: NAD-dependent epimerase/dehydratase family protein [Planctomycetales bacterium]|nr:NAD-dependent epimerase/dehydratase family protein [Planctomycetales bacterium]